ncbi:MAG: EAL domain-containing protein, partial [Lachnospiraceae bacterium]|nr:EAL domain-containing protein [Lachnospiraceae bacterium]
PLAVQTMFPYLLVEGFGEALCFLLIYASLEQRSELFDSVLGMYNKKAFVNFVNINMKAERTFSVMSVSINDIEYLEKNFGIECMASLEGLFAEYIKQIRGRFEIYHVSDYVFYIIDAGINRNDRTLADIAAEICHTCEKNWTVGYVEVPVSVDICIMQCPKDVNSLEQIFECTEYISNEKRGRGNRVVNAEDINLFHGRRKSKIKKAIHKAIKNQSFKVFYQPIYSTKKKKVNSAEALVRLFDDDLGFISPEEFIPIAEEDGSILNIGTFVLESVCRLIKEHEIKSKGIEYIEVNVSIIECMKHNMASRVSDMINQYGLEPGQINLEITETAAMNSPEVVGANMTNLVNYGVNFSLDDYGSGYSNINYLVELPFNLIKVDKNIVWLSFENERAGIALESSISMIRKLNYKIVAEGVETEEQAEKLTAMGCEYLQGYYFSKPLPEHEFLMYIAE